MHTKGAFVISIFNFSLRCICGYLQNKTRILVTHQLSSLNHINKIYIMNLVSMHWCESVFDMTRTKSFWILSLTFTKVNLMIMGSMNIQKKTMPDQVIFTNKMDWIYLPRVNICMFKFSYCMFPQYLLFTFYTGRDSIIWDLQWCREGVRGVTEANEWRY